MDKTAKETCISCDQSYNKITTTNILAKLPSLQGFDYANKCLNCIKQQISTIKADKYPNLRELKKELDEKNLAYKSIYAKWHTAEEEYKKIDYQIFMITYEQAQIQALADKATAKKQATKKASTKKPSPKKSSVASYVVKILANLSPEQQEAVLANIKAQASGKPNEL